MRVSVHGYVRYASRIGSMRRRHHQAELERRDDALDIPLHPIVAHLERLPEPVLRIGIVFSQESKDRHVVLVGDLVGAGEGRQRREVGGADAADDVLAECRRVKLRGETIRIRLLDEARMRCTRK